MGFLNGGLQGGMVRAGGGRVVRGEVGKEEREMMGCGLGYCCWYWRRVSLRYLISSLVRVVVAIG